MANNQPELSDLIMYLREELTKHAKNANEDAMFLVESASVEIELLASSSVDGKLGFSLLGIKGGSGGATTEQSNCKITVDLIPDKTVIAGT